MTASGDKVIILGGKGMLGSDVAVEAKQRGFDFEVLDLPEFDITDSTQLLSVVKDAKTIINCAAYTNVEKAETETGLACRINVEAVGNLSAFARKSGAWVLHISTDFVFDGSGDKPYTEKDLPRPINAYGRTKMLGERLLIENRCDYCILRLEWTYGNNGNNFVRKLLDKVRTQKELKVVDDQIGSPTATTEAAKAVCDLVTKKPKGVYHFASQGYTSRFGVARFIIQTLGLDVQLLSCKTADYLSAAARPLNSKFDCTKIRPMLSGPIRPWQKPLEEFLKEL